MNEIASFLLTHGGELSFSLEQCEILGEPGSDPALEVKWTFEIKNRRAFTVVTASGELIQNAAGPWKWIEKNLLRSRQDFEASVA